MNSPVELTLEQQFELKRFEAQVQGMNLGQAKEFLVMLYGHMIYKDATYKRLIKQGWGITSAPDFSHLIKGDNNG